MIPGETDSSRPWKPTCDGFTNAVALAEKVPTTTAPVTVALTGTVIANPGSPHNILELICGGTDAPEERYCLRVTRWTVANGPTGQLYIPETALIAYPTLGLGLYTASELGAGTNLWADKVALASSQGAAKQPAGYKQPVRLAVEWASAAYLEIEIELQTAASADVFTRDLSVLREARTRQLDGTFA